jgi:hypothetical protein
VQLVVLLFGCSDSTTGGDGPLECQPTGEPGFVCVPLRPGVPSEPASNGCAPLPHDAGQDLHAFDARAEHAQ